MNEEYFEIITSDGYTIHGKKWTPENTTEAVVCLIHGFFEHKERYNHVAQYLTSNNIAVFAIDLRGHGKSSGKRGHAKYDALLSDVRELLVSARSEYTDLPIFLMGHSFGGNLVANYLLRDKSKEIKGAILSSPWLRLAFDPPKAKLKLAAIMNKIFPAYAEKSEMNTNHLSRIPEVVEAYDADPLTHESISAGLFTSIYQSGNWAIENAHKLSIPTLAYHGEGDQVISHLATAEFAHNAGNIIEFRLLKDVYHEPHNDIGKDEVLKMVVDWLKKEM